MTIPTQHNCPHLLSGWCLDCVATLARERDDAAAEKRRLLELYVRSAPLVRKQADELVSLAKWMESAQTQLDNTATVKVQPRKETP